MDLEQVKEHFKYAKEVRCLDDGEILNLNSMTQKGIHQLDLDYWFDTEGESCLLYDANTNQLAEILTYVFERGEEVEVSDSDSWWVKRKFIGFDLKGNPITEHIKGNDVVCYKYIRKLQPQSLLEPELTALKDKAKEKGMNVTVIFENNENI